MSYYDFVAIDFETANNHYDSACSIGIAAVKNGEIVDTFYSLLQPPSLRFLPENIAIHGITPEMVKDSPSLDDLWHEIKHFFTNSLVVAHNTLFDMSVLNQSLLYYKAPNFKCIDSQSVAKDFVPGKKSLAHCAEYLNIDIGQHHNALDDAITCAQIVLCCLQRSMCQNIGAFCFAHENVKINTFTEITETNTFKTYKKAGSDHRKAPSYAHIRIKDIVPTHSEFDETHPFYKKCILFTGDFSIGRKEVMQLAVDVGAILKSDISKKVHYLVVGKVAPEFINEDGLCRKEVQAKELNDSGKGNIQIIGEEQFMELVRKEALI